MGTRVPGLMIGGGNGNGSPVLTSEGAETIYSSWFRFSPVPGLLTHRNVT